MKKSWVALMGVTLIAGLIVGSSPNASAACPQKKAARLTSLYEEEDYNFEWGPGLQESFAADEKLIFEFAIIPFSVATTGVWMGSVDSTPDTGYTFFDIDFNSGTTDPGAIPYDVNKWNDVRAVLDFGSQKYRVFVNGEASDAVDFEIPPGYGEADDAYGPYFHLGDATQEPDPAWLDSLRLRRRSPQGTENLFTAQFDADPNFTAFEGTMDFMTPETKALAGDSCLSTTTLNVDKTRTSLAVDGQVRPEHSNDRVTVVLFKKKNGRFRKVDENRPRLNKNSRYATSFARPANTNRCRVRTTFNFDFDHVGSSAVYSFSC